MELVKRDVVHTVRLNGDDIAELVALLEGLDRLKLSHPEIWALVKVGHETFARLVALID